MSRTSTNVLPAPDHQRENPISYSTFSWITVKLKLHFHLCWRQLVQIGSRHIIYVSPLRANILRRRKYADDYKSNAKLACVRPLVGNKEIRKLFVCPPNDFKELYEMPSSKRSACFHKTN